MQCGPHTVELSRGVSASKLVNIRQSRKQADASAEDGQGAKQAGGVWGGEGGGGGGAEDRGGNVWVGEDWEASSKQGWQQVNGRGKSKQG